MAIIGIGILFCFVIAGAIIHYDYLKERNDSSS